MFFKTPVPLDHVLCCGKQPLLLLYRLAEVADIGRLGHRGGASAYNHSRLSRLNQQCVQQPQQRVVSPERLSSSLCRQHAVSTPLVCLRV